MYTPTLARFSARDPIPMEHQSMLGGHSNLLQLALKFTQAYVYAINSPVNYSDPSGLAPDIDCTCCRFAINDFANRQRAGNNVGTGIATTVNVGPFPDAVDPTKRDKICRVKIRCSNRPCPGNHPALASEDGAGNIEICIDCRIGNQIYEEILVHELAHAKDFCINPPPPVEEETYDDCKKMEQIAYKASCEFVYPNDPGKQEDCVKCGISKSCARHPGAPPAPPGLDCRDLPTQPCWKYVPGTGFVPDPNGPGCPDGHRNNR